MTLNRDQQRYVKEFVLAAGYDYKGLSSKDTQYIFDLLSRKEELQATNRYNHHNWELNFAPLSRQANRMVPVIDRLLAQLEEEGSIKEGPLKKDKWPDGKKFAVVLSHDVDHLEENSWREKIRLLRHLGEAPFKRKVFLWLSLFYLLLVKSRKRLRWASLKEWMDVESDNGCNATYFFFANPLPAPNHEDSFYTYDDRVNYGDERITIRELMQQVKSRGFHVGLHGASNSSNSEKNLSAEKKNLESGFGQEVISTRQHHLFYDVRHTPSIHEKAGFKVDSTLGSNISTDYRCGTGLPFMMYDLQASSPIDVLQVPLVVQDIALTKVLQLTEEQIIDLCTDHFKVAENYAGCVTLLWHNSFEVNSKEFKTYQQVLTKVKEMGGWGCSVDDMNAFWRNRLAQAREILKERNEF